MEQTTDAILRDAGVSDKQIGKFLLLLLLPLLLLLFLLLLNVFYL